MNKLLLHDFHAARGARFREWQGEEVVADYGDARSEHAALIESAGLLDLTPRGRLCLTGSERKRFLHGQVTNDVKRLTEGEGCYAALITAKGKMVSDVFIHVLADEILLDLEPGLTRPVTERLEKYIIADDVQVVDAGPHYGVLSAQGPKAAELIHSLGWAERLPEKPLNSLQYQTSDLGNLYLINQPRLLSAGFDVLAPVGALERLSESLRSAAEALGGRLCGWDAWEVARIEMGIPRFGVDMDESNLPPEAGLDDRAISYTKGCYIGQEVIARVRTYGQVAKSLRVLRLADHLPALPLKGEKLFLDGKEVGFVTSAAASWKSNATIALGYIRREANELGGTVILQSPSGETAARIVALPFQQNFT